MTISGFEKRLKIAIYNNSNDNRLFDMFPMIIDVGRVVKYNLVYMFLRFKDKIMHEERLPWRDIIDIFIYDLWLLTLWSGFLNRFSNQRCIFVLII